MECCEIERGWDAFNSEWFIQCEALGNSQVDPTGANVMTGVPMSQTFADGCGGAGGNSNPCSSASRTWTVGLNSCTATVAGAVHNDISTANDTTGSETGSRDFLCDNGNWVAQAGATCDLSLLPVTAGCFVDTHEWDTWQQNSCSHGLGGSPCTGTNSIAMSVGNIYGANGPQGQPPDLRMFDVPANYSVTWTPVSAAAISAGGCDGIGDNRCSISNVPNGTYIMDVSVVYIPTGATVFSGQVTANKSTTFSTSPQTCPQPD
jgi:hypothetical protein